MVLFWLMIVFLWYSWRHSFLKVYGRGGRITDISQVTQVALSGSKTRSQPLGMRPPQLSYLRCFEIAKKVASASLRNEYHQQHGRFWTNRFSHTCPHYPHYSDQDELYHFFTELS